MESRTTLQDIQISAEKVGKKIKNLPNAAVSRPDKIGPALLQELSTEVVPILTIIFWKLLSTGEEPADWRTANVKPIFKNGIKSHPCNDNGNSSQ